jgi:hypothetical protein
MLFESRKNGSLSPDLATETFRYAASSEIVAFADSGTSKAVSSCYEPPHFVQRAILHDLDAEVPLRRTGTLSLPD